MYLLRVIFTYSLSSSPNDLLCNEIYISETQSYYIVKRDTIRPSEDTTSQKTLLRHIVASLITSYRCKSFQIA